MTSAAGDSAITILMGVRNGARFLPEQLQSIAAQTHRDWRLIASDDGSTDGSAQVIARFARATGRPVEIRRGPCAGFSENFMSLIRDLPEHPGLVAFADQDDIWFPDKLARAVAALETADAPGPVLYCARRWVWHADTGDRRKTAPLSRPPGFRNALVENIAAGNTIVLNPAAARLARAAAMRTGPVYVHDWWLYLLVTGAGGKILFDDEPVLLYRQHEANAIGAGVRFGERRRRLAAMLRGVFRDVIEGNIAALNAVRGMLTPESVRILETFSEARRRGPIGRVERLREVRPYRQARLEEIGLWGAMVLGVV